MFDSGRNIENGLDVIFRREVIRDRFGGPVELCKRTWRIVAVELAPKLVLEIEGRLAACGLRHRIRCDTRLEADDTGQFSQRIIVGKQIVFSARIIRKLFISHAYSHSQTPTLKCQRIVGKW